MESANKNFLSYFENVAKAPKINKNKNKNTHLILNLLCAFLIVCGMSFGLRLAEESFVNKNTELPKKLNPIHITVAQAGEVNNQAAFLVQSHKSVRIVPNKGFTFIVKFKNTGNKTWNKGHVYLKSSTTGLKFRHEFWPDAFHPGSLEQDYVPPGAEGSFKFAVQAPPAFGDFTGDFILTDDNVMIIGGKVSIQMIVCEDPEAPAAGSNPEPTQKPVATTEPENTTPSNTAPITTAPAYCPYTVASKYANDPNCIPNMNSNGPLLRVGLYHSEQEFIISNNKSWQLLDSNNNLLASFGSNESSTLTYDPNSSTYSYSKTGKTNTTSKYLKLKNINKGIWTINNYENRPAWNTSINDNAFKGDLEIRYNSSKNRTWLINEIEMEEYLRGIAETSNSSPIEYLKTMVVAARTYAYYHYTKATKHADEYFHVDSKYDQVYKGYNVSLRLTNNQKAINETNGIIATFEGRPIVAAYFSRSDGRTRSFREVWGNDVAYLVSVPCPYSEGEELWGHGVGIDAHDAVHRAIEENVTYDEILKYYYTGIKLEKVW